MNNAFAYANEEEKCYGLAGVAISLNVWDRHEIIRQITLDGPEAISFVPEFAVCANPRMSAKTVWNELVRQYQLLMGMAISDVMSRSVILKHKAVDRAMRKQIYELLEEDGHEICSLEDDETEAIFEKMFDYLSSVYVNAQVGGAVRRFVNILQQRRTMSGTEVEEELQRCLRR